MSNAMERQRKNKDQKKTADNALGDLDKEQPQEAIGEEALVQWIENWKTGDKV